jgi:hypothetical protein
MASLINNVKNAFRSVTRRLKVEIFYNTERREDEFRSVPDKLNDGDGGIKTKRGSLRLRSAREKTSGRAIV